MQTLQSHTGTSKAQGQNIEAGGVTGHASHCYTLSASKHHSEESQQGEEVPLAPTKVPLLQQDAKHMSFSVMDETHSIDPPPEGLATFFTSLLDVSVTEGHLEHPGHHGLRSRHPTILDFTTLARRPQQSAPDGRPEGSVSNGSEFAAGGEVLYDFYASDQHDKYAPSLGRSDEGTLPTIGQWDQGNHNQVHWSGCAAVDGQIAESHSDGERVPMVDRVDGPKHGRTSEQNIFDIKSNNGFDMDADFSVPVVKDQFELQFGTTFHPHLVCEPSPYGEGINDQRNDIVLVVLEDIILDCAEDSVMEAAEPDTRHVTCMATATRMVQFPSAPLIVPSNEYVSPSGAFPWPRDETPAVAFVE